MIPSSSQMAENIRKHVDAMAREIARRVADDPRNAEGAPYAIEHHARMVLLDWYLGDWVP